MLSHLVKMALCWVLVLATDDGHAALATPASTTKAVAELRGYANIAFGSEYSALFNQYQGHGGFQSGTDTARLEKFIRFDAEVFELDSQITLRFSNDKVSAIELNFASGRGVSSPDHCKGRFNKVVSKLKSNYQNHQLLTNRESFEGLITENAYMIFSGKRHIHAQMQIFSSSCSNVVTFSTARPRFVR